MSALGACRGGRGVTAVDALPARAGARDAADARSTVDSGAIGRSLALGWLAILPLVAAYEIASVRHPEAPQNAAEYLITLPFRAVLAQPQYARYALELVATVAAAWSIFHDELGLVRRAARIVLEGLAAAIVLGPLLILGLHTLDLAAPAISRPGSVPHFATAALIVGGAAFEEILFRVGAMALIGYVALHTFEWFLAMPRTSRVLAECTALAGSALIFAAGHLALVVGLIAPGGEEYDATRFAWRATAGLALALLYRWRGMGVAAWCHAFFNLALLLGAGPEIFL